MRSKRELQELKEELERLTCFIADFGTQKDFENEDTTFSSNVTDALSWVLEEIATEHFQSDAYLNLTKLHTIAKHIEQRTGNKLKDYA